MQEYLNVIYTEYLLKLNSGVKMNEDIQNLNSHIKENPEYITKENQYINSELNDILESVQISVEEYFQYLIDYSKYANNIVFPLLYTIFSLTIFFSLSGIIFTFLYIRDNKIGLKAKKIFRIILHILWNIILFLLLLTIISQICFKIFEIFGEDGSGLLQYATSEQNFNSSDSIIFKGAGKAFLETCFRDDDGDLLQKIMESMNEQSSKMKNLSEIFKNEILYQDKYDYYNKIELNDIQNIINNMNDMYNDYRLIRYYFDSLLSVEKDCQDDFDELNEYTDYSNILKTKQILSLNKNNTYDVWVSKEKNCKNYNKYQYINDENKRIEGNKYCMVIGEFEEDIAKKFYTNLYATSITHPTVDDAFEEYYKGFIKFEEDNKKLLIENPNFIGITQNYYNELIEIKKSILKGLEYSQKINELLSLILGNSSGMTIGYDIFTVMNCCFLKRDVKVFYIQMEKLRANSLPFIVLTIFVNILLLVCAILTIINIYKYKEQDVEKNENLSSSIN